MVSLFHVVLVSLSVKLKQPQQQPVVGNGAILAVEVQEYPTSGTTDAFSLASGGVGQSERNSLHSALLTGKIIGHLLVFREKQQRTYSL